jgi:hypothetical protein
VLFYSNMDVTEDASLKGAWIGTAFPPKLGQSLCLFTDFVTIRGKFVYWAEGRYNPPTWYLRPVRRSSSRYDRLSGSA